MAIAHNDFNDTPVRISRLLRLRKCLSPLPTLNKRAILLESDSEDGFRG